VNLLGHMLRIVMTPSSVRLAELRLSLVGTHLGPGDALGHLLVVPLGNDSPGVRISMTTGAGG
jgi:hypothetical protein